MADITGSFGAVVLAGGTGRRLGGVDKGALRVGGVPLLDRVLLATTGAVRTVVVGESRPTTRDVVWTREDPPGTGPLAGLSAGLDALGALDALGTLGAETPDLVGVFATDLTQLRATDVHRLIDALVAAPGADAALFVDAEGHRQPLAAVYRGAALVRVLEELRPLAGRPMRALVRALSVVEVADHGASADCDTPEQLAALQTRQEGRDDMLEDWVDQVGERLSLPTADVRVAEILDLAKEAAHTVARPAAPVTTFLVGYAAGLRGGGRDEIAAAVEEVLRLIAERPEAGPEAS